MVMKKKTLHPLIMQRMQGLVFFMGPHIEIFSGGEISSAADSCASLPSLTVRTAPVPHIRTSSVYYRKSGLKSFGFRPLRINVLFRDDSRYPHFLSKGHSFTSWNVCWLRLNSERFFSSPTRGYMIKPRQVPASPIT